MIYLLGLCNSTKLSNICHQDLSKVSKHHLIIDRLINMTFMKQLEDLKVLRRSPDLLNNVKCAYLRLTCADPGFFQGGGPGQVKVNYSL